MKYKIIVLALVLLIGCNRVTEDNKYAIRGFTMGTTYSIKVVKSGTDQVNFDNLQERIDSVLVVVNQQMSTYIDTSEISLFNSSKSTDWFEVSPELVMVVDEAIRVSKASQGASDITLSSLINLWGFGPEMKAYKVPTDMEIKNAMRVIGCDKLETDSVKHLIRKTNADINCDLSSVAKGHGVDRVGLFLESLGIQNYLVEIGGEIRTLGKNHSGISWKVGISAPDSPSGIQKVVALSGLSMATSGDYRNYFEEDGVRYSHLVDPRKGKPIDHNLASVTVVSYNCMHADALATAINVAGPEEGMEIAKKENVAVYMIVREKDKFVEKMTESFSKLIESN